MQVIRCSVKIPLLIFSNELVNITHKTIVCLASSRKWSGRCIVGKDLQTGQWIRPVSDRPTGEIVKRARFFKNLNYPRPLEILSVPTLTHKPQGCQQENYLISQDDIWKKQGRITWYQLAALVDQVSGELWINGYSSQHGLNDRIPVREANVLKHSVLLIQPDTLVIEIHREFSAKKKLRAVISLNNMLYKLAVTDPKVENLFLASGAGHFHFNAQHVYLCLSISEPFQGYCYKLVASILFKRRWLPYLTLIRGFFSHWFKLRP